MLSTVLVLVFSRVLCWYRRRAAPLPQDMDDQGPSAELGLYPPELDPTAPETAVADNAMDTDMDVVAQQR